MVQPEQQVLKVKLVQLALQVPLVPKAVLESRVQLARLVQQVNRGYRVLQELLDLPVLSDRKDHQELQVPLVLKDLKGAQELQVPLVRQVP